MKSPFANEQYAAGSSPTNAATGSAEVGREHVISGGWARRQSGPRARISRDTPFWLRRVTGPGRPFNFPAGADGRGERHKPKLAAGRVSPSTSRRYFLTSHRLSLVRQT